MPATKHLSTELTKTVYLQEISNSLFIGNYAFSIISEELV